jgi:hypothetical protein
MLYYLFIFSFLFCFEAWFCLATCLTLALLVARVLADNHDATVTTNDFALVANLLNAWVNLHVSYFRFYL